MSKCSSPYNLGVAISSRRVLECRDCWLSLPGSLHSALRYIPWKPVSWANSGPTCWERAFGFYSSTDLFVWQSKEACPLQSNQDHHPRDLPPPPPVFRRSPGGWGAFYSDAARPMGRTPALFAGSQKHVSVCFQMVFQNILHLFPSNLLFSIKSLSNFLMWEWEDTDRPLIEHILLHTVGCDCKVMKMISLYECGICFVTFNYTGCVKRKWKKTTLDIGNTCCFYLCTCTYAVYCKWWVVWGSGLDLTATLFFSLLDSALCLVRTKSLS